MRESNSHSSTSGKSCLLKVLLALALLGGVSILIVAIIFSRWKNSVAQELEAYKQDARAQGYPVTLEELNAWYPAVPDAENAALLYEEAFASMQETDPDGKQLEASWDQRDAQLTVSGHTPDLTIEFRYVGSQAQALAKLEAASHMKDARFPVDYTQGLDANRDYLPFFRASVHLLILSADQALAQGDTEKAANRYIQLLAIARAGGAEPRVDAQLMRMVVDRLALDEIERALSHTVFSAFELAALDAAWADAHRPDALARSCAGERCIMTGTLDALLNGNLQSDSPEYKVVQFTDAKIPKSFARVKAFARPYINYEELIIYRGLADAIPEGEPDWPALCATPPLNRVTANSRAPFAGELLPALAYAYGSFVIDETIHSIARTSLAIERYRVDHGAFPETLEACVPEYVPAAVILDPYNGEPLKYRPEEETGFKVYSVFENLVDDGGEHWEKQGPDSFSGDWVFTVTR
ncbi:MAG: hypothetical protein KJ052_20305 [Candidatus Hydrogenedentes bacterium]|nr:hypothetical protein [Candidatus Hydrogenedentota bacterium]